MKIVHLCNYIQPQLGYQEFFLAKEHARMGHDVTVLASDRYFPFTDYYHTVGKVLGNRFVGSGLTQNNGFMIKRLHTIFEVGTKTWLAGLENELTAIKPDILICHGMLDLNAIRAAKLKKRLKYRLIYDDHSLLSDKKKGLIGALLYKLYPFELIAGQADRLIGVSPQCVDSMINIYGMSSDAVEMVPLGADSDLFRPDREKRKKLRMRLSVPEDGIVITYTGKLCIKKSPHYILQALADCNAAISGNIYTLFVGDCDKQYEDFFRNIVNGVDGKIKVLMMGAVPNHELVDVYSASDIAVWPRFASISTIEAISCACPIICCDYLSERYKNNNGLPIVQDDLDSLREALMTLINNDSLRAEMGIRGRELIEQELSWEAVAKRFLD